MNILLIFFICILLRSLAVILKIFLGTSCEVNHCGGFPLPTSVFSEACYCCPELETFSKILAQMLSGLSKTFDHLPLRHKMNNWYLPYLSIISRFNNID